MKHAKTLSCPVPHVPAFTDIPADGSFHGYSWIISVIFYNILTILMHTPLIYVLITSDKITSSGIWNYLEVNFPDAAGTS